MSQPTHQCAPSCWHEYGPSYCQDCGAALLPVVCKRCDGQGETWRPKAGWQECPSCLGAGIVAWDKHDGREHDA